MPDSFYMDVGLSIKKGCIGSDADRIPSYLLPNKYFILNFNIFFILSSLEIYSIFDKESP